MSRRIIALIKGDGPTRWVPVQSSTIHNYFPDGAVSSDALIDTENTNAHTKLWQGNSGSETLSWTEGASWNPAKNAVNISCPGDDWDEGFVVADWDGAYSDPLPAGRYEIGITIQVVPSDNASYQLWAHPDARNGGTVAIGEFTGAGLIYVTNAQRFVFPIVLASAGWPRLVLSTTRISAPDPETPVAVEIAVTDLMITDGSAAVFADGASPGWSWSGTAHASASHGPQP